jgi:predicted esterase
MSDPFRGPHQGQRLVAAGASLAEASSVMILVHSRGNRAESIVDLGQALPYPGMAYLAPQAANYTWYPHSFLAPIEQNEPGITSGIRVLADLVTRVEEAGIPAERIILAGFSQGACLASEFLARHAQRYGGLLVFSGGIIGPLGLPRAYPGTLDGTPIFIGCSDADSHIPLERVHETAELFSQMGAQVTKKIYAGMGHTIIQDEIDHARQIIKGLDTPVDISSKS